MARATWSGSISFGLVNVPVKAFSATHDHAVHFHQLEAGTGSRIHHRNVSEKSGNEVDADDIELGFEISKGHYVTVDRDELAELRPESTRTIDVGDFVALDDIDPVYYAHTYWLAPADDTAERPYRLLLAAMGDQRRVGIGTVVMRDKQYLAAIRPLDGALAMSTMRFADEVVPQSAIDELDLGRSKPDKKEVALAGQIIDSLGSDWDPERYHDTYTDELRKLIRKRASGKKVVAESTTPAPAGAEVIDLMAALQASVDAARSGSGRRSTKAKGSARQDSSGTSRGTRKSTAKKAPAKKRGATKRSRRAS
jgi:DNA end-binding protein Ku